MTSLEILLTDLAADGLLVNNLYQFGPSCWRASLRKEEGTCATPDLDCPQRHGGPFCDHCAFSHTGYAFGEGPSAYYALVTALANVSAQEPKLKHLPAQASFEQIGAGFATKPKLTGVQLLRKIGL